MTKLFSLCGAAALVVLATMPAAAIGLPPVTDIDVPEPGTLPALLVGLAVTVWLLRRR